MADVPRDPDIGGGRDGRSITGTPRWVKVFGIIVAVLVLLFVVLLLSGGGPPGGHGPGRHTPSGDSGDDTPPSRVIAGPHAKLGGDFGGHAPPRGGQRWP